MSPDLTEEIRSFDIPNPFKKPFMYDFQLCPDYDSLSAVLNELTCLGYALLAVSQDGAAYTVFFRRPAP